MKNERTPRVVVITDSYKDEIRAACWLAKVEPKWIENSISVEWVIEVAKQYGADVAIVRGSMEDNRVFQDSGAMGDKIIEELEKNGIKTMCVTFAAYSAQTAPYPIARTVQRKESVVAMCEFIQKKGDVGDAFRAPID